MTRYGVENDLPKSPFIVYLFDYRLSFSSEYNMTRFFQNTKAENYLKFRFSLLKKYGFNINSVLFFSVFTYEKTEKRGFYIINTKTNKVYLSKQDFNFELKEGD